MIEAIHWLCTALVLLMIGSAAWDIVSAKLDHALDEAFKEMGR